VPRKLLALPEMPRNAMGKVNKKDLVKSISS
jgi:non-ribosomal peptide synthetase component E (peptide arylation enzyme)